MANLLELQDLYNESLARELIEQTKNGGLAWGSLGGTQYSTSSVQVGTPNITWSYYLTKTQVGSLSYKYTLDIKQNNVTQVSIMDGPLQYTNRDSEVKNLYDIVETLVLGTNDKLKAAIQYVQSLTGANG